MIFFARIAANVPGVCDVAEGDVAKPEERSDEAHDAVLCAVASPRTERPPEPGRPLVST